MEHRGACSADGISGDGSGIMSGIPWELFQKEVPSAEAEKTGVAMIFLPQAEEEATQARQMTEEVCQAEGLTVVAWREVPTDPSVVGRFAKANLPGIQQLFLESSSGLTGDELERKLYVARKLIEKRKYAEMAGHGQDFYICSMSCRTIVYKGMLNASSLGLFYKDLQNEAYTTAFAIYHRRFSTNTNPKWPLAQPMRFLGHNGEINTLQGNLNWMASRQETMTSPVWSGREADLHPLCDHEASDSANLDRVAEFLTQSGVQPGEAVMLLVPEAYRNHPDLMANYPEVVDFYEFYEGLQEGWDGPALLIFSNGKKVGARLDRNGLRPARYWETADGTVYVASEVGVFGDVIENAENVVIKGRLGPGQMVLCDLEQNKFYEHDEITKEVALRRPYKDFLASSKKLSSMGVSTLVEEPVLEAGDALRMQAACGMGLEDAQMVIESMAQSGVEPTFCMGDTTPLPVLSPNPHMLYNYFKQRFAQVTNPPIDPLREGLVMSLEMRLGGKGNLLDPGAHSYAQLLLDSPILLESELEAVKKEPCLQSQVFTPTYTKGEPGSLDAALEKLAQEVEQAVRGGCQNIILSDKYESAAAMEAGSPPCPMLLAVGSVHHHLVAQGIRNQASIVAETAQCFTTHHVAVLVGYGAHAICPYLGLETTRQWRSSSRTANLIKAGKLPDVSIRGVQRNYKKALEKGLLKILSKMGISLLSCYHGAQIFEIYGLGPQVVERAFRGSVSRIGGLSMDEVQAEAETFWAKGFPESALKKLEDYGYINSKPRGEFHATNQTMSKMLHRAVGLGKGQERDDEAYKAYQEHHATAPVSTLRNCLEFASDRQPIPLEEVEPLERIMARFCTGGMSLGAISRETHETIAIAMNRIGGKSNSGEGGEDRTRWEVLEGVEEGKSDLFPHLKGLKDGDTASSMIKQVASGRFGVTPEFLVNARQLEIKVAQGAKPGEGGQLPGKKVSPYIANLRRSKPGVPLISPPPHHDIYSIEDLAQLIHDLHQANPAAHVSVKLVAEAGIGTVASGVAKANADVIQVSGHDGGTGASPISSIKHAGGPVEMGLAETHQSLVRNELRDRVVLRVDGGVRDGRDVMMMAALGADEYGFGTVAMIATGCIMARVCHTNNCPVGVASQREELRARFPGTPGDLVNFFMFVGEEVRQEMAQLGFKSMDELIGRADILRQRPSLELAKTANLDLSFITTHVGTSDMTSSQRIGRAAHSNGPQLDDVLCEDAEVVEAIQNSGEVTRQVDIVNTDRAAFGRLAGLVAKRWGDFGFQGLVRLNVTGSAGQSFGAWLVEGMEINLEGEANDYVGKGMAGGVLSIVHPKASPFDPSRASLVGNTCLYGATGGKVFVNGRGGERFGVRNSAVCAVVEGVGDHACEYMTGGVVVCLGSAGRNVGAGMTGGLAYFYDELDNFPDKVNTEIVAIQRIRTQAGSAQLRGLLEEHVARTRSSKAQAILDDFEAASARFWQLVPPSEASTPEANPKVQGGS